MRNERNSSRKNTELETKDIKCEMKETAQERIQDLSIQKIAGHFNEYWGAL